MLEPLLGTIVLGAGAIELAGTPAQREALLPQIAAGKLLMAFCHAEPGAGYARDYVHAVASADGGGFVIDGEKTFALGAHAADTLVVSARIGSDKGPVGLVPGSAHRQRRCAQCRARARRPAGRDGQPSPVRRSRPTPGSAMATPTCSA